MKKKYHPDRCTRLISEKFQSYMERGNKSKHFNLNNFLKEQNCTSGILCIMFFVCFLYFSHFDILFAFLIMLFYWLCSFLFLFLVTIYFCFSLSSVSIFSFSLFFVLFYTFFLWPKSPLQPLPLLSPHLFPSSFSLCSWTMYKEECNPILSLCTFCCRIQFHSGIFFKSRLRGLIVTG